MMKMSTHLSFENPALSSGEDALAGPHHHAAFSHGGVERVAGPLRGEWRGGRRYRIKSRIVGSALGSKRIKKGRDGKMRGGRSLTIC